MPTEPGTWNGDSAEREPAASGSGKAATSRMEADAPPGPEFRGTGFAWGGFLLVVLLALIVIAAAQNTQDVGFEFLWVDAEAPLVVILLIAIGTTVVIDEIIGLMWRRRRRHRLSDREELRRLRNDQVA